MKFRIEKILPEEEFRLDLFIKRMYGEYTHKFEMAVINANPLVDFTNLETGTELVVPERNWIFSQELMNV